LPLVSRVIDAGGGSAHLAARDALLATADDPRLAAAFELLPRTLVHGDMHDANIIVGDAGATIVDWGTARLAPGILDVANIAALGSANHRRYLRACERLGAPPTPRRLVELGYHWAQVQITTQYLGWVATARPEDELAALVRARSDALAALGRLLEADG
jgi:aminoglycoside phosphotransferase (APT) family kinase protein